MRQVKAQSGGHARPARPQGRAGKASHRASPARAGKRRGQEREDRRGFDPESTLARLQETWPFRHPMLSLTIGLLGFGMFAAVLANGYIGRGQAAVVSAVGGVFTDAGFAVRPPRISGNERTSDEDVVAALDVKEGASIFSFDPAVARRRLLALPWVADAEVSRHLPDTVSVRLFEKRPFALWRNGNRVSVVERSGAIITSEGVEAFRLPVIAGSGAPQAAAPFIDTLGSFKAVSSRVRLIERMGDRRWDLKLDGDITVRLPEFGWEDQLKELDALIGKKGVLDRDIEVIDLRYPENLIFRLHNGDSRPLPRQQRA